MPHDTCIEPGCDAAITVFKHRLCQRHYHSAWRRGFAERQRPAPAPATHRMVAFDQATMTGTCAECGDVRVVIRHDRPKCWRAERRHSLKNRHGLSYEQLDEMLATVDGCCELCGVVFGEDQPYCVDHDHTCCPGQRGCGACVRGLLCRRCNVAIGMMRDDPAVALRAADYLWRTSELQLTSPLTPRQRDRQRAVARLPLIAPPRPRRELDFRISG